VTLNGDLDVEPDEDFSLVLQNPVNTSIADGSGTGTILNDDEAAPPPNVPALGAAGRILLVLVMIGAAGALGIRPRKT